jgi:hypothetical protein
MIFAIRERPAGITILTMLEITLGIVEVITGLLLGLAYAAPGLSSVVTALVGVPATFIFLLPVLAALWITFAVLSFILACTIWIGRSWSWVASLVFTTNALTIAAFGLLIGSLGNIIPIIVIALVLISLSTYSVRLYLGRVAPLPPPPYVMPAAPPPSAPPPKRGYGPSVYGPQVRPVPQPTPYQWAGPVACPTCGTPSYPGANYCNYCQTRLR